MRKCVSLLNENHRYEASATLLTRCGAIDEALDICLGHEVTITDEMADRMCDISDANGSKSNYSKADLMNRVAECCMRQGAYLIASKKYAQVRCQNIACAHLDQVS